MEPLWGKNLFQFCSVLTVSFYLIYEIRQLYSDYVAISYFSKVSRDEKITLNHRGMPRSMKIFLVNILVACLCLNQVAGEDQIGNGKDELLSVRSLRNWVSKDDELLSAADL